MALDMATKNQTRPNCAKVKVEVDLVSDLPKRIKINEEIDTRGELISKWIPIKIDFCPKNREIIKEQQIQDIESSKSTRGDIICGRKHSGTT